MTVARALTVLEGVEGVFHCMSRCVRRAFLCGYDKVTDTDYAHRKRWIQSRLRELSRIFYIDVCGYAVMENHLHVVLRTRPDLGEAEDDDALAHRWWCLFPHRRTEGFRPAEPTPDELASVLKDEARTHELRRRLSSLSWFMRCLKEPIARRANAEDEAGGRFWEGRFKCTVLKDQAAVLTCTAYVDLNPIRAGEAFTPETSAFTSAQDRILAYQAKACLRTNAGSTLPAHQRQALADQWLCPLTDEPGRRGFLNVQLDEYLELLDWTGRRIVSGKRGAIPDYLAPILERMAVSREQWLTGSTRFGSLFYHVAGSAATIRRAAASLGKKWLKGVAAGNALFLST